MVDRTAVVADRPRVQLHLRTRVDRSASRVSTMSNRSADRSLGSFDLPAAMFRVRGRADVKSRISPPRRGFDGGNLNRRSIGEAPSRKGVDAFSSSDGRSFGRLPAFVVRRCPTGVADDASPLIERSSRVRSRYDNVPSPLRSSAITAGWRGRPPACAPVGSRSRAIASNSPLATCSPTRPIDMASAASISSHRRGCRGTEIAEPPHRQERRGGFGTASSTNGADRAHRSCPRTASKCSSIVMPRPVQDRRPRRSRSCRIRSALQEACDRRRKPGQVVDRTASSAGSAPDEKTSRGAAGDEERGAPRRRRSVRADRRGNRDRRSPALLSPAG